MKGYYRFPTICKDLIVFVCEDDLWGVKRDAGIAYRLTSNLGEVSHPFLSPDGGDIAFTGREEGNPEVYCMPSQGGIAQRLTYLGARSFVVGWSKDGKKILFASDVGQPFAGFYKIYAVGKNKDIPKLLPVGAAREISYGPKNGVVIGRNVTDPARWKRYRGGRVGELWIDKNGNGNFKKLINLKGNLGAPMWIGKRIYFISDHEGIGNLYSCNTDGKDLRGHTHHTQFYVRNTRTDNRNIVYHCGGDIYIYYSDTGKNKRVDILYHSPRVQTNRKFVEAKNYLEDYALHPKGEAISLTTRGKVFSFVNWAGPVHQNGSKSGARYRLSRWLKDGKRIVLVSDEDGEDSIQIHYADNAKPPIKMDRLNIGRPIELEPSPNGQWVALTNHRFELVVVDLKLKKSIILDRSKYNRIQDITWSPDSAWLAYSFWNTRTTAQIKLCGLKNKRIYSITRAILQDFSPSFDPDGKYLYFLSNRDFDPVYDTIQFELSFPANIRPYLMTLRKDIETPFKYTKPVGPGIELPQKGREKQKKQEKLKIDLDGIEDRVIPFPLASGRYGKIIGMRDGVLFSTFPIEGGIKRWFSEEIPANGTLECFDFNKQKKFTIITGISNFKVAQNKEIIIYRAKDRLRVIMPIENVAAKLKKEPVGPKSGWLDLSRIKVMVEPLQEWRQMYRDAWRLQRDHYWRKDMSGVDWEGVYKRYLPLLERIGTRAEFSDLIWEMQGELGTSHAYEWGGDYRKEPQYRQGFLGAEFKYKKRLNAFRITKIVKGDPWNKEVSSPLLAPGVNVKEGDLLLAIDGKKVNKDCAPWELLVNRAGAEVSLTVANSRGKNKRIISVKTLRDETPARYRDWVEANREMVHKESKGKIGYLHIPDMGPSGFAEFHRYFLSEINYSALIVDVRFNRGGHVSQLLLEKLARKRVGYDITRWGKPEPYPCESVLGPMVALTNEYAGSDGDIFSHGFKLYKLGPLIGKRTWGGVVGISPYFHLSDGGLTTQPEYSFWFVDVEWGVENYGTDPDIAVDIRPQDYVRKTDPQLQIAIKECQKLLKRHKPKLPDFKIKKI